MLFMQILGLHAVERFGKQYPASRKALDRWTRLIKEGSFGNFVELRRLFPTADIVGNKVVFNIGGNKIRAITVIDYKAQRLLVTEVLTHKEYDKGKWKE